MATFVADQKDVLLQVRKHAMRNWTVYSSTDVECMKGHLMVYPVKVSRTGRVTAFPGQETLPDAPAAYIMPKKVAAVLPSTLVT